VVPMAIAIHKARSIPVAALDHLSCGLVVRVPGYRTEMYRVSCEVRTEFIYKKVDRLCGLVVRVSGYRTEMYCVLRYELNLYMLCRRKFTLTMWNSLSAKVGTNFADKRRRSVGIVRSRTQATEFSLV
jgi:hypothetical protein